MAGEIPEEVHEALSFVARDDFDFFEDTGEAQRLARRAMDALRLEAVARVFYAHEGPEEGAACEAIEALDTARAEPSPEPPQGAINEASEKAVRAAEAELESPHGGRSDLEITADALRAAYAVDFPAGET